MPVIYTTGVRREDNWDNGSWSWKNGRSGEDIGQQAVSNVDGNEIVAEIAPGPKDIVVLKQKPSGFFGTNMASYLTLLGCDSVIVTGTTTSGLRARKPCSTPSASTTASRSPRKAASTARRQAMPSTSAT